MHPKNHNRRRPDYDRGNDWPQDIVLDGLLNRIMVKAPRKKLKIREGTETIVVDEIREITIGKLMEILVDFGVLEPRKNGGYTKKTIGFGDELGKKTPGEDHFIEELCDAVEMKNIETFDRTDPEQRKALYKMLLTRGAQMQFGDDHIETLVKEYLDEFVAIFETGNFHEHLGSGPVLSSPWAGEYRSYADKILKGCEALYARKIRPNVTQYAESEKTVYEWIEEVLEKLYSFHRSLTFKVSIESVAGTLGHVFAQKPDPRDEN